MSLDAEVQEAFDAMQTAQAALIAANKRIMAHHDYTSAEGIKQIKQLKDEYANARSKCMDATYRYNVTCAKRDSQVGELL